MYHPENNPAGDIESRLTELLFTPAPAEFRKRLDRELRARAAAPQEGMHTDRSCSTSGSRPRWRLAFAGLLALLVFGAFLTGSPGQSLAAQLFP